MRLHALSAEGFRNLDSLRLEPHPRFNIFEGKNGQGKTNVLEAIYVLGAMRSFRESKISTLIAWEASSAVVRGEVASRGSSRTLALELVGNTRRAALDDHEVSRLNDYFGHLHLVVFAPDDLTLTKGSAGGRRRFIDRAIFNTTPLFLEETRDYLRVLRHRNDLLRRGVIDAALLATFDETLVRHGSRLLHRRLSFLRSFDPVFREVFAEITGGAHRVDMRYQSGVLGADLGGDPLELADIESAFSERLESKSSVDVRRGYTTIGPHADDLILELDDHAARNHASQGQHRTFALALKIAELRLIREAIDVEPILLLDDVSSELDEDRNAALMSHLDRSGGQVFITTTDRRWIQVKDDLRVFQVEQGRVTMDTDSAP